MSRGPSGFAVPFLFRRPRLKMPQVLLVLYRLKVCEGAGHCVGTVKPLALSPCSDKPQHMENHACFLLNIYCTPLVPADLSKDFLATNLLHSVFAGLCTRLCLVMFIRCFPPVKLFNQGTNFQRY